MLLLRAGCIALSGGPGARAHGARGGVHHAALPALTGPLRPPGATVVMASRSTGPLGALDALRAAALRAATSWGPARWVLRSRDRRVALQASTGVVVAAGATLLAPAWLYVLAPVLLGVPHVVSDLRYLLVRRAPPPSWVASCVALSAALLALRAAVEVHFRLPFAPSLEVGLGALWVALGAAFGARASSAPRRGALALALTVTALAGAAAVSHPLSAQRALLHAHNLVGLVAWVLLFRRARRAALLPLTLIAGALALVASGPAIAWSLRHGAVSALGAHILTAADAVSPTLPGDLGVRLAFAYVFLQSVHYAAWLAWIPQEDLSAEGSVSFRASARSLSRDLGVAGVACALACSAAVLLAAFAAVHRARAAYLSLATFHVYFELAALAFLACRGARVSRGHRP